jgi:hypothetical protein
MNADKEKQKCLSASHDRGVFRSLLASMLNVRIGCNLVVLSHKGTLKDAGRCDQQLIGWVAMERLRQSGGFHDDLRMEVQKRYARLCEGAFYPKTDGPIELQPSVLYEFSDFPTGDDAHAKDAVSAKLEQFAVPRL